MKRTQLILAGLLALAATACAPQVDVEAEKNAIRALDREWENATNANGVEGWLSFVTEDAVLYPPDDDPIVRGKEAIGEYMQPIFPPNSSVRWQPDHIEVSSAGDMAYMFGTYEIAVIGPEGDPVSTTGKYGNTWTKLPDGTWIAVAAIFNSSNNGNDEKPSQTDDIEAISALFASVLPLISSDGVDGLFSLYTDDVILMVPDRWTDLDRQGALAFYTDAMDWGKPDPDNYRIAIEEVVVMGDWAFVRTKSTGLVVPASGDPAFLQGSRHISILRRQPDGAWKIARDMFHNPPVEDID